VFSAERLRLAVVLVLGLSLAGCGGTGDDLFPSGSDLRAAVTPGSIGSRPGEVAADFTLPDSLGAPFKLSDMLAGGATPADAVVLYFTMWCPICLSHTDHMLRTVVPQFQARGDVVYVLVDYVSGSPAGARASEIANGYAGSDFIVLADEGLAVFNQFDAAMGTTVVIGPDGTIHMNEDYRTGGDLIAALDSLLP
jgi:peroxiredoxin